VKAPKTANVTITSDGDKQEGQINQLLTDEELGIEEIPEIEEEQEDEVIPG
jgi:hypothetical protein